MRAPLEIASETLRARQADFAHALFDGEDPPRGLRGPTLAAPVRRFGVYRNNMLASLIGCLRSTYPAVRRLVGDDFFDATARHFVERQPPLSPVLLSYGGGFDAFLQSFEPAESVPYLSDVARLEWHVACASHAEDIVPTDGTALSHMTADEAAHVRLLLHPSMRLMRSPFSVVSIWRMNIHGAEVCDVVAPHGGEAALVVRPRFEVHVEQLDRGSFEFVAALSAGYALAQASAFAAQCSAYFDLAATLVQIFTSGAVVDIVPAGQPHPMLQSSKGRSHA